MLPSWDIYKKTICLEMSEQTCDLDMKNLTHPALLNERYQKHLSVTPTLKFWNPHKN